MTSRRPVVRLVGRDPLVAGPPDAVAMSALPDQPFCLHGTTVAAVVDGPEASGMVLRAVARGADAVVRVDLADAGAFLDALSRLGATRAASVRATPDTDQRRLLELLADGCTASEAARRTGMSVQTAHRRLDAARTALGAGSNVEAIARLAGTG